MTTVTVNFSQAALTTLEAHRAAHPTATLAGEVEKFIKAGYNFTASHSIYASGSLAGPEGYLDYPDGTFQTFAGLVNTAPGAANGSFSAGSLEEHVSGSYRLVYDGQLNFGYTAAADKYLITAKGGTVSTFTLQQLITSGNVGYDSVIGNTVLKAHGAIVSGGNQFSGVIDTLSRTTELFEQGGRITGTFNLAGDATAISQNAASATVSGTLTSYSQYYTDGSSALISGAAMAVSGATVANEQLLLANAANFDDDDVIGVTLPATVGNDWLIASGGGNDRISITGGGAHLAVNAGSGRDTVVLNDYGHAVNGGEGVDTAVFAGSRAAYAMTGAAGGLTVRAAAGGDANTLSNMERIQFSDTGLALDVTGSAGQLFRLYQSAFNRAPDVGGAGFWLKAMDDGLTLEQIAAGFTMAPEFKNLYGATTTDPVALVTKLYQNTLEREPEPAGLQFWLDVLARGVSVPQVMLGFSESPESQGLNAGLIANGYQYTPFV